MAELSDGFIVLPGGFGTLDELAEILTLVQTKKSRRIPIILVHEPFWAGLLDWFRTTLVDEGTINAEDMELIQILDEPDSSLDAIFKHYEYFLCVLFDFVVLNYSPKISLKSTFILITCQPFSAASFTAFSVTCM